jgi:hypothetical protein
VEATASRIDTTCGVFRGLDGLDPNAINRFVVGENTQPQQMSTADAEAELGDPFATLLLLKGEFPQTAEETLERIAAAAGPGDPLAQRRSFVLGEGSQLPEGSPVSAEALRFVVASGSGQDQPDVIVSAFNPLGSDIELMAWDRRTGGFNYYRTVGDPPAWVFAGNSRHALVEPTRGKGPFESHASGAMLMKELEIPWNNWHSFEAEMPPTVFPPGDPRATHPWFTGKLGAEDCEIGVAIPSMERWARARFEAIAAAGGKVGDPRRILEQVLGTPTVNLISSRSESRDPDPQKGVALPATFFVSAKALTSPAIGLDPPPAFVAPTANYLASIAKFAFRLDDGQGFELEGDTKFAFLVPERAREDDVLLSEAIDSKLISPRLAAALLMVDFPNPIFSARREKLLDHVPATAVVADGASGFSQEMADAILAAAPNTPEGSPEREFADRWNVGEPFAPPFNALLADYFAKLSERIATQEGLDDYTRLAESRRRRANDTFPIIEFPLLFPRTNIPAAEREMRADAAVAEIGG